MKKTSHTQSLTKPEIEKSEERHKFDFSSRSLLAVLLFFSLTSCADGRGDKPSGQHWSHKVFHVIGGGMAQ